MERTHFFDRLFPTRSRPPVPDAVYLPHPWGRTAFIHGRVNRMFLIRAISRIHAVVILISAIGLVIASAAFATSWETSAMRAPGGGLIRIGMTRQEVLKELGQPQRAHAATHNTAAGGKSGKKGSSSTYRADDGLYTITFSGERVVRIVVTPNRD
jgi:hypothetical protein